MLPAPMGTRISQPPRRVPAEKTHRLLQRYQTAAISAQALFEVLRVNGGIVEPVRSAHDQSKLNSPVASMQFGE
jgi:hypothetical protein